MRSGSTPVRVTCATCGALWVGLGTGCAFSQPPIALFERHGLRCAGRAILLAELRTQPQSVVWFDVLAAPVQAEASR